MGRYTYDDKQVKKAKPPATGSEKNFTSGSASLSPTASAAKRIAYTIFGVFHGNGPKVVHGPTGNIGRPKGGDHRPGGVQNFNDTV